MDKSIISDQILTLREVASYLKLAAEEKLPVFKVGGSWRFKNDTERLEKLFDLYTKMTTKITRKAAAKSRI